MLFQTTLLMLVVILVLLSKLCSLQNIIRRNKLIQTFPIPKSRDFSDTLTVYTCSPLRCVSSHPRFTGLTYPAWGYINWRRVSLKRLWPFIVAIFIGVKGRLYIEIFWNDMWVSLLFLCFPRIIACGSVNVTFLWIVA